ncbi:DUF664 domain-containing protein [Rhodococcus opacus]|uniref:mycothiol transferase n=1 Tax=Rhodococcus opacus TaxID=37919 RepID=UPI003D269F76
MRKDIDRSESGPSPLPPSWTGCPNTFGRSVQFPPCVTDDAEDMDMWATPDESREYIVGQYRTAWAHADDTIRTLPLDATVGLRPDNTNVPAEDRTWWQSYRTRLQRAAREAEQH